MPSQTLKRSANSTRRANEIEIIDLMANQALAQRHQIVAIPTLTVAGTTQADHRRFIQRGKGVGHAVLFSWRPVAQVVGQCGEDLLGLSHRLAKADKQSAVSSKRPISSWRSIACSPF